MSIFYNQLELHYYFYDNSHEIDALFRNECEKELLILFKEVIDDLDFKIKVETVPPKEGGFVEVWQFVNENKEIINVVLTIINLILTRYPVKNKKLDKLQIENLELDNLLKKEELRKLGIDFKNVDESTLNKVVEFLIKNYKIIWRRSNFFKKLTQNRDVKNISINKLKDFVPSPDEKTLRLGDYEQFILFNEDIPDITNQEVTIDLISSVLKSGRFPYKGFLSGQIINFIMEDEKFKKLVFEGKIPHNNKIKIKVILNHSRKIDDSGQIKITKYYVSKVLSYAIGNTEHKL